MGTCVSCHRGDDRTDRKRIAHYRLIPARYATFSLQGSEHVARGKAILERFGCRRCHVVRRQGTKLAASLDRLGAKSTDELVAALDRPAIHMPDFRFSSTDRDDLVNYILWLEKAEPRQGTAKGQGTEIPVVVHFTRIDQGREHSFEKQCGGCHKALTVSLGGVGRGVIGPNLSALFTIFYPGKYRDSEKWTPERLREWLKNPRKVRSLTTMPPVVLEKGEAERIIELLSVDSPTAKYN